MKYLLPIFLLLGFAQASEEPPTWKGYQCMGWTKPEAQAIADGESEGDSLAVNTVLTPSEKRRLSLARQAANAAYEVESNLEHEILASHGYQIEGAFGEGPCGEFVGIRADEYHITQFVPSNPKYPGDSGGGFFSFVSKRSPSDCRNYFAELRKRAVKATYGNLKEQP